MGWVVVPPTLTYIPVQTSPASSVWSQLLRPQGLRGQSRRASSPPPHPTSSIHTGPSPGPNLAPPGAASAPPHPSSLQATAASRRSHPSSQTVPQRPPCQTSRRPAHPWGPDTRRSRSGAGVGWRIQTGKMGDCKRLCLMSAWRGQLPVCLPGETEAQEEQRTEVCLPTGLFRKENCHPPGSLKGRIKKRRWPALTGSVGRTL